MIHLIKKTGIQFTVMMTLLWMTACSEKTEEVVSVSDNTYSSAVFTPSEQFKTHQIAAFVVPTDQASLSFQVSGIIDEQFIKIGDSVELGQELFKVTNPSLEPQIQQFISQIDAINATLEQNQAEVMRFKNLKKTNAISQNELDKLTNQRDNLEANKKSLEAQLEQAQSLFDESILKAPFAGNIAEIYKETGEVISPGEVVLVVGGVTSLEAPIFLPSSLHRNISFEQEIIVNYNQKPITAKVKEISFSANPKSQLFKIMLDVPIKHGIKSGEKIIAQINENIGAYYRLPIESVIDDGINQPFVFLIDNHQVIKAPIELIEIVNNQVIIEMPFQGDVEVVTAGQVKLSPEQKLDQS